MRIVLMAAAGVMWGVAAALAGFSGLGIVLGAGLVGVGVGLLVYRR